MLKYPGVCRRGGRVTDRACVSRDSDTVPVLRCIEVSQQNYVKGLGRVKTLGRRRSGLAEVSDGSRLRL